jgi:hypothetical protein
VASVPDKRNSSKQRRAARNRASRDSLAARRENAVAVPESPSGGSGRTSSSGGSARTTATKGAARGTSARGGAGARPTPVAVGPPPKGLGGYLSSTRPGDRLLLVAFGLSVLSVIYTLFFERVDVDDRGEPLPLQGYRALTIMAREALGGEVTSRTDTMLGAYGPAIILFVITPLLITAYALWANRRVDRARVLTFALIALAVATMMGGSGTSIVRAFLSFGALIALGVGVFQIRKADMAAGMAAEAAQPARTGGGRGKVIEADTVADDDADDAGEPPARPKSLLDRLIGPGAAGGARGARTADTDADDVDDDLGPQDAIDADDVADAGESGAPADDAPDPLAELEAELAAEADAEQSNGEDASPGNGSRRRRR